MADNQDNDFEMHGDGMEKPILDDGIQKRSDNMHDSKDDLK